MNISYSQHPLSSAFPHMEELDFVELSASIESTGLLNPIVLYQGMVLDGWHRYCACQDSNTAIKTIEYTGKNPREFVLAQNKSRRHLTKSQIALSAVKVYDWLDNGVKQGLQGSSAPSAEVKSTAEIAKNAGVSKRTIEQAKLVETKAPEEIKAKVVNGEISLKKAEEIINPKKEKFNIDDYAPSQTELDEAEAERQAKEHLIETLMVSDEAFAELAKKFIQVEAMNRVLESRNNGLMNENAALSKIIKARDRLIAKLQVK